MGDVTEESTLAVERTKRMMLPKHVRGAVDTAFYNGHALVSHGCALFYCVHCGGSAFLDDGPSKFIVKCRGKKS